MFGLDVSQQEAIGLTYIFNQLTPLSPFGEEKKKQMTPFAPSEQEALMECFDNIEKIILLLKENKKEVDEFCFHLMSLKNIRGVVHKCESQMLHQVELFEMKAFLMVYEKAELVFRKLQDKGKLAGFHLKPLKEALELLDPEGKRIVSFVVESEKLNRIRKEKRRVEALLQNEVTASGQSVLTTKRFQLVKEEGEEEARVQQDLTEKLRPYLPDFLSNMDYLGKLDLLIAKSNLASSHQAVRPEVSKEREVVLENMWNPFVAEVLTKNNQTLTKVSLTLPEGVTIITGANMGGKSVSVKTATLNVILCQLGFFVFADVAKIPLFDGVYLISEDLQDIGRGLSSFGAEMNRFNQIVGELKESFLFIVLDEFAKGTNPTEGTSIVRGVASFLWSSGSVCVMTTHYDRVVSPKYKHYQVVGLNVSKARREKPSLSSLAGAMDYNLKEADHMASPPQDALHICELLGVEQEVLERIRKEYL